MGWARQLGGEGVSNPSLLAASDWLHRSPQLQRLCGVCDGHLGRGRRPQPDPGREERLGAPSAQRESPRGRGPHKALLWLGLGRHRGAFVPPLTPWQARLTAGQGQRAGYVPGRVRPPGAAPLCGRGRAVVHAETAELALGWGHRPGRGRLVPESEEEPGKKPLRHPNSAERSGQPKTAVHPRAW